MNSCALQINFKLDLSIEDYNKLCEKVAKSIAQVPGLRWKLWIINDERREAGGLYLFDNEASLQAYLNSPIVGQLKSHPCLREVTAKPFSLLEGPTRCTSGTLSL